MKVTVNNQDKEEAINWSKVQLLEFNDEEINFVVLTNGKYKTPNFQATVISSTNVRYYKVGHVAEDWDMEAFNPFLGSITLQND
jgi:hypothetical protein